MTEQETVLRHIAELDRRIAAVTDPSWTDDSLVLFRALTDTAEKLSVPPVEVWRTVTLYKLFEGRHRALVQLDVLLDDDLI